MKNIINKLKIDNNHIIIAYSSVLLSPLIIIAMMIRPIADDFVYFTDSHITNPFKYAFYFYFNQTGRLSQAFLVSSLYRTFGDKTVIFGAIIQLLLLIVACIVCCYAIFYRKKKTSHVSMIALGLLFTIISLLSSPSLFDTYLWLTSSTVYTASMIALFFSIALAALFVRYKVNKIWKYIGLFLFIFIAQLFSEPTSVIMICMSAIFIVLSVSIIKNKNLFKVSVTFLISSILGFLTMYFSPGSHLRQINCGSHFNLNDTLISSFFDISKLSYLFTTYRIYFIVILALFISTLLPKLSKKITTYSIIIILFSIFVVAYSLFVTTRYSMGSYIPFRTFSVPTAIISILFAIAIGTAISFGMYHIPIFKNSKNIITSFMLITAVVVSSFTTLASYIPVIHAVAQRSEAYDTRALSIKEQVATQSSVIHITPLPTLLINTEGIDFYYGNSQVSWFESSFRKYYSIPITSKIIYDNQPQTYCSIYNNPGWTGAKDCNTLVYSKVD